MQLDNVSVELRVRNHWEAIDLGFAMVRRWWWPVYSTWLAVVLPLAVLLNLLCWQQPWLAALLLWWLKPVLDRLSLHVLSRALFGELPGVKATLTELPKILRPQLVAVLTWLRFDPARAFHLPVIQLEGLRGQARRQRQLVLGSDSRGSVLLTVVCMNIDLFLQFALVALVAMLFPEFVPWEKEWWLQERTLVEEYGFNFLALIALSLIEPFYVAAGFALYLNRRTILEAWDLEIGFRRLAQRLRDTAAVTSGSSLAAILIFALIGWFALPLELAAQESVESIAMDEECERFFVERQRLRESDSAVKHTLAEVLEDTQFGYCQEQTVWDFENDSEIDSRAILLPDLGAWLELILWGFVSIAGIVLVAWLLKNFDAKAWRRTQAQTGASAPLVLHGRAIKAESFDRSAADRAWTLWQSGQRREALGLLYRATLAGLMQHRQIDFGRSATELECLQRADRQLDDARLLELLRQVTRAWQLLAYAHRAPEDRHIEQLCRHWTNCFGQFGHESGHAA